MDILNDWEVSLDINPALSYQQGFEQGISDARLVKTATPNQNGYTLGVYCDIRDRYMTAIYALQPTDWQRGYGDGFDEVAADRNV